MGRGLKQRRNARRIQRNKEALHKLGQETRKMLGIEQTTTRLVCNNNGVAFPNAVGTLCFTLINKDTQHPWV